MDKTGIVLSIAIFQERFGGVPNFSEDREGLL